MRKTVIWHPRSIQRSSLAEPCHTAVLSADWWQLAGELSRVLFSAVALTEQLYGTVQRIVRLQTGTNLCIYKNCNVLVSGRETVRQAMLIPW